MAFKAVPRPTTFRQHRVGIADPSERFEQRSVVLVSQGDLFDRPPRVRHSDHRASISEICGTAGFHLAITAQLAPSRKVHSSVPPAVALLWNLYGRPYHPCLPCSLYLLRRKHRSVRLRQNTSQKKLQATPHHKWRRPPTGVQWPTGRRSVQKAESLLAYASEDEEHQDI